MEAQARSGRCSNASDYVRDLIRRDQERAAQIAQLQAAIVWKHKMREHHIVLTWPVGHQERSITLQRR